MSQAVAVVPERQTKLQSFIGRVIAPSDREQISAALPAHVPYQRFERNLANAIMNQPKLMLCDPREVFREVAKIAALGLLFDAQLGEAYLIASGTGPQARIGYRGLIKLGRQSGDISLIYAHEVYENDEFECILGDNKRLTHKPNLLTDRGRIVLYYAVVKFKDGETDFEPMTLGQIDKIRDKSDGYKAFKANKIKDTPWVSSYEEMAKKTVLRRLCKRLPMSPDLAHALEVEDAADRSDETVPARRTLADRLRQSGISDDREIEGFSAEHVDAETGEVTDAEEAEDASATASEKPADVSTGPDEPTTQDEEVSSEAADEAAQVDAEETLLDRARRATMAGKGAFLKWYGKLSGDEQGELTPHFRKLKAAAEQVDGGAK